MPCSISSATPCCAIRCSASYREGRVCQIGFLGGLEPVADFNPLADLPSGVALSTFASAFVLGGDGFPLTDVPVQAIVKKAERGAVLTPTRRGCSALTRSSRPTA